jgi:hypothetical protein
MEKNMGFDLYGVKPKIKEGTVKPERPDWNNCSDAEKDEYFSAMDKFEQKTKVIISGTMFGTGDLWHSTLSNTLKL